MEVGTCLPACIYHRPCPDRFAIWQKRERGRERLRLQLGHGSHQPAGAITAIISSQRSRLGPQGKKKLATKGCKDCPASDVIGGFERICLQYVEHVEIVGIEINIIHKQIRVMLGPECLLCLPTPAYS